MQLIKVTKSSRQSSNDNQCIKQDSYLIRKQAIYRFHIKTKRNQTPPSAYERVAYVKLCSRNVSVLFPPTTTDNSKSSNEIAGNKL
ncbi:hypothetical protein T05_13460 [Trichinella murrelli]|uniref:Uncharacterized protein n=1 Tax=Trichinella murrelli TaxID=144512 RepID=A0A0V0TTY7_9BILA|nr:hypothetical protein T05_13460 [Trichinella murrelli]